MKKQNCFKLLSVFLLLTGHFLTQAQTCATCPGNVVTGIKASAFGESDTASGDYSFIAGRNSSATKNNSTVIGSYSIADGLHSFVVGSFSEATASSSYVFGNNSKANAGFSLVIGHNLQSTANESFVIGVGQIDNPLISNIPYSLSVGFNSNMPTLFVGETPNGFQSGRVGIGNIINPEAKLHIRADANEDASLKLETSGEGYFSRLIFTNAHSIKAKNQDHLYFNTAQGKDFVFHQGDIYLDDIQSGIIMKSPNGLCWRGTLNDQGTLTFVQITCPEETTTNVQTSTESAKLKLYPNPTSGKLIVETSFTGNQAELILRSTDGKILLHEAINGNKTEINLNHISSGIYVMQLVQNDNVIADEKVVVE